MADTVAAPTNAGQRDAALVAVPLLLALVGVALRYAAYWSNGPHGGAAGFAAAMCVWDCSWYADIVLHGYQAHPENLNFGGRSGIANWAFFPLYPLLVAAVRLVAPADPASLGAVVSPLLTL